jgi:type VI protein secretion system component VasF
MNMTAEKIRRIRGHFGPLSPAWAPPPEAARTMNDPMVRRLAIIAAVCAILMILLFATYKIVLSSGAQLAANETGTQTPAAAFVNVDGRLA